MNGGTSAANNFNWMRLVAAWLVLLSHSYHLNGVGAQEPLLRLTGGKMTLGTLAVGVFFAISGYLITASGFARPSLPAFLAARVRRIFPALLLVVLLSALVLGPVMTTLAPAAYFTDPAVLGYIVRNVGLLHLQFNLPGVFGANPYGPAVNGSLWTLPIEFSLYLAVGGAVWALRRLRLPAAPSWALLAASAVTAGCWLLLWQGSKSGAVLLVPYFLCGAALRLARNWLPLHGGAAAALAVALALATLGDARLFALLASVAIPYGTLWLARHPRWVLPLDTARLGDLSYGVYLFAFPVQQTLLALGQGHSPLSLCLQASALVVPLAWLSWHGVERHCVAAAPAVTGAPQGAQA
jgi:peptidoglycan/LPS O-acetylase OafA/YrhL